MFKKLSVPKLYKVRRLRHHQTCYQTSGNRKRKIWPDFYVVWTLSPGCWCQGVHIWGQKSKNMTTLPTGHAVSLFVRLISCQFSFVLIPSSSVPSTLPSPLSRKLPAVTHFLHSLTACKMTSWWFLWVSAAKIYVYTTEYHQPKESHFHRHIRLYFRRAQRY